MLRLFYPCEYAESVFSIDYEKLYKMGYRGILFDIDGTLVPHGNDSTEAVDALFRTIHEAGLKTLMLSNNSEERIRRFLKNIDSLYIYDAGKPHTASYDKAVKMLDLRKEETLCIGDQIFTDILGSNKSGIDSILVKFLCHENETKIGKRRTLEMVILWFYSKSRRYRNRLGDIYL